jgi:hypothetical protein
MIVLTRTNFPRGRPVMVAQETYLNWGYRFGVAGLAGVGTPQLTFSLSGPNAKYNIYFDASTFNSGLPSMTGMGLGHDVIDPKALAAAIMASPQSASVFTEMQQLLAQRRQPD